MEKSQPQQSKEGEFLEKNYKEGQVFKRKDCLNYDLGCATYSGKYYINCDGVVMKFNDDKGVLSDFCELINYDCPEVLWAVTKDIQHLERKFRSKIEKINNFYNEIKT